MSLDQIVEKHNISIEKTYTITNNSSERLIIPVELMTKGNDPDLLKLFERTRTNIQVPCDINDESAGYYYKEVGLCLQPSESITFTVKELRAFQRLLENN